MGIKAGFLLMALALSPWSAERAEGQPALKAGEIVRKFLNLLGPITNSQKQENPKEAIKKDLSELLHPDIVPASFTDTEISRLNLQMLNDELPILQYMKKITGHNVSRFLEGDWTLVRHRMETTMEEDVIRGKKGEKNIRILFFKGTLELLTGEKQKQAKSRKCEIDLIEEPSGRYRIAGFIM